MAHLSRRQSASPDEENPYWVSFSDLMSGLLIIFILAAVALIIELTQKSMEWDAVLAAVAKAENDRRSLVTEIEGKLQREGIPVFVDESKSVITIPESALQFEQSRAEIPNDPHTLSVVTTIGAILLATIENDPRTESLDTVFIEGHSDCLPYRGLAFDDNWDLSAKRSNKLWRYWTISETGDPAPPAAALAALRNGDDRPLFSVSGYGETRPLPGTRPDGLCAPERPELLSRNRRIDLRFTIKAPTEAYLERLRETIQGGQRAEN